MRIHMLILASICVGCADSGDQRPGTESASASSTAATHAAEVKAAAPAAEASAAESTDLAGRVRGDSVRAAARIPSDAELSAMVRRISPDSLSSVPGLVRTVLKQRGCLIPQPFEGPTPSNFATGAFTAKGAVEWAILCSIGGASQILIITAQTGVVVDSLRKAGDTGFIQGIGNGKWGFSRVIATAPNTDIRGRRTDEDGKVIPRPVDHDGIDEAFLEKANVSYFLVDGTWYRVITSD